MRPLPGGPDGSLKPLDRGEKRTMSEPGTLLYADEAKRFIEQIEDPLTRNLVNLAFGRLVQRMDGEKGDGPRADLDALFLVRALRDFFSEPGVLTRAVEGKKGGAGCEDDARPPTATGASTHPVGMTPAAAQAHETFHRELPALLEKHAGMWVAYSGTQQLGLGKTSTELHQRCLRQGLKRGEFIVRLILPDDDDPQIE